MRFSKMAFVAMVAVLTFTACAKNSNTATSSESSAPADSTASATSAPAAMAAAGAVSAAAGAKVYSANCSSCHQANGQGVPGAFPPLGGSAIATGDVTKLIHIVKYGLTGAVQVAGKTYNGQMPNWSPQLSDADIASVITYVRSSWGNKASDITTSQVTAVVK